MTVCSVCVMDDSAAPLDFDESGQCECCRDAFARKPREYFPNEEGQRRLETLVDQLREEGRGKNYDCMVGLSGGIDSAYLAHILRTRFDLRLLAVHVDGGWNSEPAVYNIERLVRELDIDLHTHVIEWEEMRDLQLAFLKSGVINQDIPQDHAFFATLYRLAKRYGIRHFLSGVNFSTESIRLPKAGHPSIDGRHLASIHKKFGTISIVDFPILSIPRYVSMTRIFPSVKILKPLNLIEYNKADAIECLNLKYRWKEYGDKHSESRFTKFYQDIYLYDKLRFDKRRIHFSSMIVSGQISRASALNEIKSPPIGDYAKSLEIKFVAKKLGINQEELNNFVSRPIIPHSAYKGDAWMLETLAIARKALRFLA